MEGCFHSSESMVRRSGYISLNISQWHWSACVWGTGMVLERCVRDEDEAGKCCLFSFWVAPSSISLIINYSLNWRDSPRASHRLFPSSSASAMLKVRSLLFPLQEPRRALKEKFKLLSTADKAPGVLSPASLSSDSFHFHPFNLYLLSTSPFQTFF